MVAVPILVQHHPGMWLCVDNSTCCQQADASCEVCFKGQRCLLQHVCDLCAPALADVSMCVYLGVCKHVAAAFPHFFLLEAKGGWDWELRGTKLSPTTQAHLLRVSALPLHGQLGILYLSFVSFVWHTRAGPYRDRIIMHVAVFGTPAAGPHPHALRIIHLF